MTYKSPNAHLAKCPAVGCKKYKAHENLMCYTHWELLSNDLRNEAGAAIRKGGLREAKKLIPEITSFFIAQEAKVKKVPADKKIRKYWWEDE